MTLNRKIQPPFHSIESINLINPVKIILDNSIPLYSINAGTQDVLKIDISFDAGTWYQSKPLISTTVNEMLTEGTVKLSSVQISEKLDYYGAFIQPEPSKDFASVSLFTLKRYLPETITLLADIIKNPIFPENEVKTYMGKRKQSFLVEMEKVSNLARRQFNKQLFGQDHPYGKNPELQDHDLVKRSDLIEFHKNHYHPANCRIIVAGKVDDEVIKIINTNLGDKEWSSFKKENSKNYYLPESKSSLEIVNKNNASQASIRIGKITITKSNPDYPKLEIVNTILGGYFGSRLMKTIREEKGYTYGIGSYLVSLKNAGFFVISSEVGTEVTKAAVIDIMKEIRKLREEFVSKDELEIVRNFMLGDMMRAFDGPFEQAQSYKTIIELGIDNSYFDLIINTIKSITSEDINLIANKYLNEENMTQIIAGEIKE